jgi:hypothetical protein
MDKDSTAQAVQFWMIVKALIQKLEDGRQSAIASFIEAAVADPASQKGEATLAPAWKTKLDAAVKPWNEQLAAADAVRGETESLIRNRHSKSPDQVESAFRSIEQEGRAEEEGRRQDIAKFLGELRASTTPAKETRKG